METTLEDIHYPDLSYRHLRRPSPEHKVILLSGLLDCKVAVILVGHDSLQGMSPFILRRR